MRPGDVVRLDSPTGLLLRGEDAEHSARLVVKNGAKGVVVGASGYASVVVAFDDLGAGVGVAVPERWLAQDLGPRA